MIKVALGDATFTSPNARFEKGPNVVDSNGKHKIPKLHRAMQLSVGRGLDNFASNQKGMIVVNLASFRSPLTMNIIVVYSISIPGYRSAVIWPLVFWCASRHSLFDS